MPEARERKAAGPILAATLALALLAGSGCANGKRTEGPGGPTPLAGVEVREYRGERLSSIGEFRENSIKGPQQVDKDSYRLRLSGLVQTPTVLTYDEVLELPAYRKVVRLDCVEGWGVDILWEGVLVRDLLSRAGVRPATKVVIFHARDGFSTSFPLRYLTDRPILMAHKMNGVTIPPERGFPFMLVAEDKWGYKWVKWIDRIELSSDAGYRGYWESRGYSNSGDRSGSFLAP